MADIQKAGDVVREFLKKVLGAKKVKIVRAAKVEDGWEAEAEVYEESSFIKSLGLPTRVTDRNVYEVKLDNALELKSYECRGQMAARD